MAAGDIFYFSQGQYNHLADHCNCWCGHKRKHHDRTMVCMYDACQCAKYGRRSGGRPKAVTKEAIAQLSTKVVDAQDEPGQEWSRCMHFDDTDVLESCGEPGENVATIEVPLG